MLKLETLLTNYLNMDSRIRKIEEENLKAKQKLILQTKATPLWLEITDENKLHWWTQISEWFYIKHWDIVIFDWRFDEAQQFLSWYEAKKTLW